MICDTQGMIGKQMFAIDGVKQPGNANKERSGTHAEPKHNAKGVKLKSNTTDNDSAKRTTSKGVIQGYAAQAAVDSKHQVIVAADVIGSISEQAALLPMVYKTQEIRTPNTLFTADAGYHSQKNLEGLREQGIPAMIADNLMRKRDEGFAHAANASEQWNPCLRTSDTPNN